MADESSKSGPGDSSGSKGSGGRGRGGAKPGKRRPTGGARARTGAKRPAPARAEPPEKPDARVAAAAEPDKTIQRQSTDETVKNKSTTEASSTDAETPETVDKDVSAGPELRRDEAEDATVLPETDPPVDPAAVDAMASATGERPEQALESSDVEAIAEATAERIEEAMAEEASAISDSVADAAEAQRDAAADTLKNETDALAAAFGATAGAAAASGAGAASAGATAAGPGPQGASSGPRAGSGGGSGDEPPEDDEGIGGPNRRATPGGGWLLPFAAAILGAVVGGGGAYVALKGDQPNTDQFAARFVEASALDQRLAAVETAVAEQVTAVSNIYDGRASEIDARVGGLAKQLRVASAEAAAAVAKADKNAEGVAAQQAAMAELADYKASLAETLAGMQEKIAVLDAPREAYAHDVAELRGLVANLATLVTANGVPGAGQGDGAPAQVGASGDPLGAALATRMALLEGKLDDMAAKFDAPSEAEAALGTHVDAVDARVAELETRIETLATTTADQQVDLNALANGVAATGEETAKWRADIEQAIELTGSEILRHDEWIIQADEHLLELDSKLANTFERFGAVTDRLDGVDAAIGTQLSAALTEPVARIGALDTATKQQGEAIGTIETRVAALEQTSQAFVRGEAAVGVAFAALSQAVSGADPYEPQLQTLTQVAEIETPAALGARAATGLPSKISLATRFVDASRKALAASHRAAAEAEDSGIVDSMLNRMSSIIVVRRIDETEGDDPGAVLSRAGARVDEGDVAAALKELEALPPAGRKAIAGWIADAEARVAAEQALAELRARLLGVSGQPSPAATPAPGNEG